jgi:hypothetical protein
MNEKLQQVLLTKGLISTFPPSEQAAINACAEEIRSIVGKPQNRDRVGSLALALVSYERLYENENAKAGNSQGR